MVLLVSLAGHAGLLWTVANAEAPAPVASVPDAVVVELVTLVAEAAPAGESPAGPSVPSGAEAPVAPVQPEPAAFAFAPVEAAPLDPALVPAASPVPADFAFAPAEPAPLDPALADALRPRIPAARPQRARPAAATPPEPARTVDLPDATAPNPTAATASAASGASGTSAPSGRPAPEAATAYAAEIRRRIDRAKRYPAAALAAGQEGVARLRIVVARDGAVVAASLVEGSGFPLLDDASLKAARAAAPFPAAPEALPGDRFDYVIPIRYQRR
jgi:protein TonB